MPDKNASTNTRRGPALAGLAAAVLILVVAVVVFVMVRSGDDKGATAAPESTAATLSPELQKEPEVTKGDGAPLTALGITEIVAGAGPVVQSGQTVTFNYKLVSYTSGEMMDSSWSRGEPFTSQIGVGSLIKGWDQGIPGQKVGSRIQMDVPADLAYGPERGDLRFVVDILDAK
ncbi:MULTISPECIES: FKBP-type peptidyl-prolyl cis-trans isomerase [Actinoplanes]|uniref:FKBP-type peptidyl-prolyl cis-trans isomerase n=1 Tax=Actinoplanes TaxID=1865 RepID=UPI00069839AA|nr:MULTISPECIES: FKBP-type peptidyl-prolyl cis-trans isomerase [Actinoplanes]